MAVSGRVISKHCYLNISSRLSPYLSNLMHLQSEPHESQPCGPGRSGARLDMLCCVCSLQDVHDIYITCRICQPKTIDSTWGLTGPKHAIQLQRLLWCSRTWPQQYSTMPLGPRRQFIRDQFHWDLRDHSDNTSKIRTIPCLSAEKIHSSSIG